MNTTIRNIYLNHHNTYPLEENIRFELAHGDDSNYYEQLENDTDIDMVENGKKRAMTLFEEVFKDSETVQIIFITSEYSNKNRIAKFLHKNQFRIVDSFITNSWDGYFDGITTVLVIETEKANLRLAKLIDGLCYQDFYRYGKLKIKNPLIFYNAQDNLILNIYDDRGCDIWSNNFNKQKKIYTKYNTWILDYDRESISKFYGESKIKKNS